MQSLFERGTKMKNKQITREFLMQKSQEKLSVEGPRMKMKYDIKL
jgi:hypothetical protein